MPCDAYAARAVALRSRFQKGMVVAWHGRGMGDALHVLIKHSRTV
jgi:hypothetical protein